MINLSNNDYIEKSKVEFPDIKKTPQADTVLSKIINIFSPYINISYNTEDVENTNSVIRHTNAMRASKLELLQSYQEGNKERIGYIYGVPIVTKNATSSELSIQDIINYVFSYNNNAPITHL